MNRTRAWMAVGVLGAMALLTGAGCGGGLSTEEATQRCDDARTISGEQNCINDAAYAQCTACYEECGDACIQTPSCIDEFSCPAE